MAVTAEYEQTQADGAQPSPRTQQGPIYQPVRMTVRVRVAICRRRDPRRMVRMTVTVAHATPDSDTRVGTVSSISIETCSA